MVLASGAGAQSLADLPELELSVVDTLRLPSSGVRGLSFDGGRAWLLVSSNEGLSVPDSPYVARILRFDPSTGASEVVETQRDAFEAGLAHGLENLWAGGSGVGTLEALYRLDRVDADPIDTLPSTAYHPGGLVWDREFLWQVDCDARQVLRIEPQQGKVSRRIATPGLYPTGLAFDGVNLWNADAATGRLYRIRPQSGKADGVARAAVFSWPGEFVTLGFDGRWLWVVPASSDRAIRLQLPR